MNKLKIRNTLGIAVILSTLSIAPSYAFTLTGTSAVFDNAQLSNGKTVGRAATNDSMTNYEQAAFEKDSDNYVEFFDYNGVNQVRWGDPVDNYYSSSKTVEGGHRKVSDYGYYRKKNNRYYKGHHKDRTAQKSGLGFAGVSNIDLAVNEVFNIGTLKHYNNTIWADGRDATRTDFSLNLDFGDTGLGTQTFDFALNIDETINSASSHEGGVCPYETTGNGCSDQITWDFVLNSENSFDYEGEQFKLELVGFSDTPNFRDGLVQEFISQENGTSEANLFARIVKLGEYPDDPTQVPEPGLLLGFGAVGLLLKQRRHHTSETVMMKA